MAVLFEIQKFNYSKLFWQILKIMLLLVCFKDGIWSILTQYCSYSSHSLSFIHLVHKMFILQLFKQEIYLFFCLFFILGCDCWFCFYLFFVYIMFCTYLITDTNRSTACQRTARYTYVHYIALVFLCTFSVFHCGNLYFFMLHFFHAALFSCCTFFILHHFHVALFFVLHFCFVLFQVALLHVAMFSFCTLLLLRSFLLHFALVALFPEVQPGAPQTSKMKSFATIINKAAKTLLNIVGMLSTLVVCGVLATPLLFPCCTIWMS